jgi:hypothetical protein
MKTAMPKAITDLSERITAAKHECDTIAADIGRAEEAAKQAERITAEIEAVSRERAERKAMAFVSRQPADLAELDKQMAELESANRSALEDGTAAAMAAAMLKEKLAQQEKAVAELESERHTLALEWLAGCREKAIDRYIKALSDLGPVLAEAVAADRACHDLGARGESIAEHLLKAMHQEDALPVPWRRRIQREGTPPGITLMDPPFGWWRDDTLGDPEHAQFLYELRGAGLLP